MSDRPDAALGVALVGALIVAAYLYSVSKFLGADFKTTASAVGYSAIVLGVTGGCLYFLGFEWLGPCSVAGLAFLWPGWWPVLRSIAAGGRSMDEYPWPMSETWYTSGLFLKGSETVIVIVLAWLLYRVWNQRLRY
ncbi:hypothetical protein [Pandoraea apista]|uniref:hypothetical protein n=1 Tax=Pandoraea apista TaxID=93218 RepID=UPI000F65CE2B|nr:hypothetical protein [Pandoraea apista]RRW87488.1 hypothetical protein EGJ54_25400 [Pandoraea apista]RRW95748.1 hypothetical protein EGJ56_25475 [Pandoraea apista]